ncbi:PSI domain-containing protein [Entamoeba marina]
MQCSNSKVSCSSVYTSPTECIDCTEQQSCSTCTNSGCHWCTTTNKCQAIPNCEGTVVTILSKCSTKTTGTSIATLIIVLILLIIVAIIYGLFIYKKMKHPKRQQYIPNMRSPYPPPPIDDEVIEQSEKNKETTRKKTEDL